MPYGGYTTVAEEYRGSRTRLYSAPGDPHTPQKKERFSLVERLHWGKLLLCAALFAALVFTKVNMPERFDALRAAYARQTEQSIDYRAVFGAVGRAVSGEKSVQEAAGEVYMEVFHPNQTEGQIVETAMPITYAALSQQEDANVLLAFPQHWSDLGAWLCEQWEHDGEAALNQVETAEHDLPQMEEENTTEKTETADEAAYAGRALPENVSMEQRVLNLTYTTPVSGWLSSEFGYREHPVDGEEKFHHGLDIAAAEGTEICAFADGTVKAVGESSSLGNYVMVDHGGGLVTTYAHCSRVTAGSGAQVKKGEKIAEVGHTGLATGSHLHFAMQQNEVYLNPIYYVSLEDAPQ